MSPIMTSANPAKQTGRKRMPTRKTYKGTKMLEKGLEATEKVMGELRLDCGELEDKEN